MGGGEWGNLRGKIQNTKVPLAISAMQIESRYITSMNFMIDV